MTPPFCAHSSCSQDHHSHDEEIDPCMAQDIAKAEKDRILYEKLKVQSDRLLMNLNIRTNKMRVRGAVSLPEDDHSCSSDSESAPREFSTLPLISVAPALFDKFYNSNRDKKIFTLCIPCDFSAESDPESLSTISAVFDKERLACKNENVAFSKFSKTLCVCGKCEDIESRAVGSLRSVAMILKKSPSIVLTRNGGLVGIWTENDGELISFISKHT